MSQTRRSQSQPKTNSILTPRKCTANNKSATNRKSHVRNPNFDDGETKFLIKLWSDPKVQQDMRTFKKNEILNEISTKMKANGYNRSADEISTRIKNLKCIYNRVSKDFEKGNEVTWKYYEMMNSIFHKDKGGNSVSNSPKRSQKNSQASTTTDDIVEIIDIKGQQETMLEKLNLIRKSNMDILCNRKPTNEVKDEPRSMEVDNFSPTVNLFDSGLNLEEKRKLRSRYTRNPEKTPPSNTNMPFEWNIRHTSTPVSQPFLVAPNIVAASNSENRIVNISSSSNESTITSLSPTPIWPQSRYQTSEGYNTQQSDVLKSTQGTQCTPIIAAANIPMNRIDNNNERSINDICDVLKEMSDNQKNFVRIYNENVMEDRHNLRKFYDSIISIAKNYHKK